MKLQELELGDDDDDDADSKEEEKETVWERALEGAVFGEGKGSWEDGERRN